MSQKLLEKATVHDIYEIEQLAKLIWNQYYQSIISQEQINYMLKLMYSPESILEQMQKKKHQFYFIRDKILRVGFVSVSRIKNRNWFLNKFYIDQKIASRGIGSKAFQELNKLIKPKKITLTVNRQNFKAVNFYFKNGFIIDHVADFEIGNGFVMNDFVMVWKK